jgi:N-acetylglucosamine malate deacetylase 1
MKIVVFSPHPDDAEVLMGGTIAKYTQKGHQVQMVLVTIPNQPERRKAESQKAADILGAELRILDINAAEIAFNRQLVERFDEVITDANPDIIYTSWIHDSHQDHMAVANATIAATRKNSCSLYMYEQALPSGLTPYHFRMQNFVDISDVIDTKARAISEHKSQVEKYGEQWLQGVLARAAYIGYRINTKHAEAFEVIRDIREI